MRAGGAADVKSDGIIEISGSNNLKIDTHNDISVISLEFWSDGGCPLAGGGAADVKSNEIIEISGPNNPKIDTHNDIIVISITF